MTACLRLASLLEIPHEQQPKKVPDGHGRSYGSGPWQKYKLGGYSWLYIILLNQTLC